MRDLSGKKEVDSGSALWARRALPDMLIETSFTEKPLAIGSIMATLMFFDADLKDQKKDTSIGLELGRSSFYRDESMYLTVEEKTVILTREQAKEFYDAVVECGAYLGLDK